MIVKSFLVVLTHVIACYGIIYFVLPRFLLRPKWWLLIMHALVVGAITFALGILIYSGLFQLLDNAYRFAPVADRDTVLWISFNTCCLNAAKVIAVAVTIKLLKNWWKKQREKERLEKEKLSAELNLLKSQVRPEFLFNALDNIQSLSVKQSALAPESVLKLSELLSYLLYECDHAMVPLEQEIRMIENYLSLEKLKNDLLEVEVHVKGNCSNRKIAPFLLMPFIENGMHHCDCLSGEKPWLNLDFQIEEASLTMKLIYGLAPNASAHSLPVITKRLELLYANHYRLKTTVLEEMEVVILQLPVVPELTKDKTPYLPMAPL